MSILWFRIVTKWYQLKNKLSYIKAVTPYRFWHWMFFWTVDDEGDLTLRIAGILFLTKYKEHTVIRWFKDYKASAPKHLPAVMKPLSDNMNNALNSAIYGEYHRP